MARDGEGRKDRAKKEAEEKGVCLSERSEEVTAAATRVGHHGLFLCFFPGG